MEGTGLTCGPCLRRQYRPSEMLEGAPIRGTAAERADAGRMSEEVASGEREKCMYIEWCDELIARFSGGGVWNADDVPGILQIDLLRSRQVVGYSMYVCGSFKPGMTDPRLTRICYLGNTRWPAKHAISEAVRRRVQDTRDQLSTAS